MENRNAWTELIGIIAHDLNMPITSVQGFIQLIQHGGTLTDKQKHYTERALAGLDRMSGLVSMMLDLAWVDADKSIDLKPVDVLPVIDEVVMMMETVAVAKGITLHVEADPSLGTIMADRTRLPQIFSNLITNAVKYNRKGGSVWIKASGNEDQIQVSVRDEGAGIPQEKHALLFEPFYRAEDNHAAKIEGTGLGLAIVKGVVEKHQGKIWVESAVGQGSTFHFMLPRAPQIDAGDGDEPDDDA